MFYFYKLTVYNYCRWVFNMYLLIALYDTVSYANKNPGFSLMSRDPVPLILINMLLANENKK